MNNKIVITIFIIISIILISTTIVHAGRPLDSYYLDTWDWIARDNNLPILLITTKEGDRPSDYFLRTFTEASKKTTSRVERQLRRFTVVWDHIEKGQSDNLRGQGRVDYTPRVEFFNDLKEYVYIPNPYYQYTLVPQWYSTVEQLVEQLETVEIPKGILIDDYEDEEDNENNNDAINNTGNNADVEPVEETHNSNYGPGEEPYNHSPGEEPYNPDDNHSPGEQPYNPDNNHSEQPYNPDYNHSPGEQPYNPDYNYSPGEQPYNQN